MMVPVDLDAIDNSPFFSQEAKRAFRQEPGRAEELKAFAAARRDGEDESIASFVRRHFGDEVTEKVAWPLLAGVFGGDIGKLSTAAVMAVFLKMEREHGSLILALQKQRRDRAATGSVFTSLRNGLQSLIDGMAVAIPPEAIHLKEAGLSITPRDGRWSVATASDISIFDELVIATPVHVTQKLVAPLDPGLGELLDIEATSAVVAAFAYDREAAARMSIPEGFGFLVPQRAQTPSSTSVPQLLAGTFVHQKFSNRVPEGCALIRAFFGGDAAPALLSWSDNEILALARRNLSSVFGELPDARITLVRRWPRSLPQYHVGHRTRVARIESIVAEHPGLHLIGNGFHGVGLPDLIHLGRQTALSLLASRLVPTIGE
jgi:oxygen-dependent protoporphyrinogen oxidase